MYVLHAEQAGRLEVDSLYTMSDRDSLLGSQSKGGEDSKLVEVAELVNSVYKLEEN